MEFHNNKFTFPHLLHISVHIAFLLHYLQTLSSESSLVYIIANINMLTMNILQTTYLLFAYYISIILSSITTQGIFNRLQRVLIQNNNYLTFWMSQCLWKIFQGVTLSFYLSPYQLHNFHYTLNFSFRNMPRYYHYALPLLSKFIISVFFTNVNTFY